MRIAIVSVGHSKFGKRDDVSVQELAFESFKEAMENSNVDKKDIDASIIGSSPEYHKQRSLPGVITEYLGLNPKLTYLTEAACASGSAGMSAACAYIKAGLANTVLVMGVQKMLELTTPEISSLLGRVGDVQWESVFGTTFAGYYAMYANKHMAEFGTKREQLAKVAVKNHHYGFMNPKAMFQKEITLEKAMGSRMVAYPLTLYDCCANADGSACVILTNEELAKKYTDEPVFIDALGYASAEMSVLRRKDLSSVPSTVLASKMAYKQAGIEPKDVDVADVHDCFTIAEIMAYEDLGFCEKGQGGKFIDDEQTYIGGKIPVNVDGGLKTKGHPIGATGTSMFVEGFKQLRAQADKRQVSGAEVALTHNIGGIGQYCFVGILRR